MNKTIPSTVRQATKALHRCMKLFLALMSAFCIATSIRADDSGLWTDAEASQKLGNTGINLKGDFGLRLNNHWKSVDRWDAGLGLSYDVTRFLEAGGGYTFICSHSAASYKNHFKSNGDWNGYNIENGYRRFKNRFYIDVKGKADAGRFTFSLRERCQSTVFNHTYTREDKYRYNAVIDEHNHKTYQLREGYPESRQELKKHKTTHYLRSRLQAEYNIKHSPVTPYVSFELSNSLTDGFSIDKRRFRIGADWKIAKGKHFTFGYVYNNGNDDDEKDRLHAIEIGCRIKGLFSK